MWPRGAVLGLLTALLLQGCTAAGRATLSGMMGLTHTETSLVQGQLVLVTNESDLENWRYTLSDDWTRKIFFKKENSVGAGKLSSEDSDEMVLVILVPYDKELCSAWAQLTSESVTTQQLLGPEVREFEVNHALIKDCEAGRGEGRFELEGQWGGGWTAQNLPALLSARFVAETEYKYRYSYAGTRCADGWISQSSGRGTCSWHGGVAGPYFEKEVISETGPASAAGSD